MNVNPADLVGASTIADRLCVSRQGLSNWIKRDVTFPDPLLTPGLAHSVWLWPVVLEWYKNKPPAYTRHARDVS